MSKPTATGPPPGRNPKSRSPRRSNPSRAQNRHVELAPTQRPKKGGWSRKQPPHDPASPLPNEAAPAIALTTTYTLVARDQGAVLHIDPRRAGQATAGVSILLSSRYTVFLKGLISALAGDRQRLPGLSDDAHGWRTAQEFATFFHDSFDRDWDRHTVIRYKADLRAMIRGAFAGADTNTLPPLIECRGHQFRVSPLHLAIL